MISVNIFHWLITKTTMVTLIGIAVFSIIACLYFIIKALIVSVRNGYIVETAFCTATAILFLLSLILFVLEICPLLLKF